MKMLTEYMQKAAGMEPEFRPARNGLLEKLPLFIRTGFRFFEGKLAGRDMVFLFSEGEDSPAPKQLQVQVKKIEDVFGVNAVLVMDDMDPYMRNQLTQKKMAFVVPDEQMYIPFMFISLDERIRKRLVHVETFYPATQALLIYHLWKKPLNGLNLKEIAAHLDYTAMTVTRAVRELEAAGLCITRGGRQKIVEFEGTKRKIWEKAERFMKNPVKEELKDKYVNEADADTWILAGINALAVYSNLDAGYDITWAVKKEAFKKQEPDLLATEPGDATIQMWTYDPVLLSENGITDPFSVYLTLKDRTDERVQIALEEMMADINKKWAAEEVTSKLRGEL